MSAVSASRHFLPNGLVHVVLEGFDDAPATALSTEAAVSRRDAVERRFGDTYLEPGHERWFFHAFDDRELVFVVARWEPRRPVGGRYVGVERIRVARVPAAERALGAAETIREYDVGSAGVKADMTANEVEVVKGKPERVLQLGPFGAFDWIYADQCVRFLGERVARVGERGACAP